MNLAYLEHHNALPAGPLPEDVEFLEHWGVKGMRWGVRNDKERQARREQKAKKYDARAQMLQTKISEIDAKLATKKRYSFGAQRLRDQKFYLVEDHKTAIKDAEAKRQGKLSKGQKTAIKGAAIAAGIIAAYTAYSVAQSGEGNRLIAKGKEFITGDKATDFKKNLSLADPNLDADGIFQRVVKGANPNYGSFGTKMNCRRATFAYEMRRRGNEVVATKTTSGYGQNFAGLHNALDPKNKLKSTGKIGVLRNLLIEKVKGEDVAPKPGWTPKVGPYSRAARTLGLIGKNKIGQGGVAPDDVIKAISKLPNGARGELGVKWMFGGGHSMAWEVVKGRPVIFDVQTGTKITTSLQLAKHVEAAGGIMDAGYTRLDDLPLNADFLLRWVKNV